MSEESLELLCEELLTQSLLDECPVLVDALILLCHLWISLALSLILCKELLECVSVKASCLLIVERSLSKHGVGAFVEYVLQFAVCYGKSYTLCLVLNELGLHVCVPYHVLNLIELVLIKVFLTLLHFDDFGVFVNHLLKISNIDFLS